MRIGITGASGFIGRRIIQLAAREGHALVGFSRSPSRPIPGCRDVRAFDPHRSAPDVSGLDAVIHLAGENVFGLWTEKKKRRIRESRLLGTRRLVEAMGSPGDRPAVLVSSSGVSFYGNTGDLTVDEKSPPGGGFLGDVARDWEAEAMKAADTGVRVAVVRTGLVLGVGGGALAVMAPVFRWGLGGEMGDGRQWMSWIHLDDIAGLYLYLVEHEDAAGAFNGVAPEPCRNADFTDTLAEVVRRPALFKVPAPLLRMPLREFSSELLDSKRVVPARTLASGFTYHYPELQGALRAALDREQD